MERVEAVGGFFPEAKPSVPPAQHGVARAEENRAVMQRGARDGAERLGLRRHKIDQRTELELAARVLFQPAKEIRPGDVEVPVGGQSHSVDERGRHLDHRPRAAIVFQHGAAVGEVEQAVGRLRRVPHLRMALIVAREKIRDDRPARLGERLRRGEGGAGEGEEKQATAGAHQECQEWRGGSRRSQVRGGAACLRDAGNCGGEKAD